MKNKNLIKNSILFTIAPFLPKVVNVLLLPIMTQYLTDVDFGISGTISAYTSAISAFATLGLTVVLQNTFFKTPETYKDSWGHIYGFLSIWMWVYALVQAIILYFCIPEEAIENRWWIIVLTNFSTVFFGPTATIGSSYFIYTKQAWPVVWRSILASVATIIIDFILIVYMQLGYMGWYIGSFAGIFISNITYWLPLRKKLGLKPNYHFKWETIKKALWVGGPTIPHYYTSYLLEGSGRMVMDRYNLSQGEIGQVSISQQIGGIFSQAITGLNNAVSPYVMNALKEERGYIINQICYLFCFAIFASAFVISLWSKEIFQILLSNETLKSSYPYLIIYLMAFCYRPMYIVASYYYFFYEQTKKLLGISFTAGVIAIALYVILTPMMGVWGFLIGHYIACLYFGYSGYIYRTYKSNAEVKIKWWLIMFIQVALTILAFYAVEKLRFKVVLTIFLFLIGVIIVVKSKYIVYGKQ